jgi:hypothetical protein
MPAKQMTKTKISCKKQVITRKRKIATKQLITNLKKGSLKFKKKKRTELLHLSKFTTRSSCKLEEVEKYQL